MRILYGVVGEGMGHATRSRVVLEHLCAANHEILVVVSGRAHQFLKERFVDRANFRLEEIHGLHLKVADNEIDRSASFWSNLEKVPSGLRKNIEVYDKVVGDFSPDVVVSDFESWAYFFARFHQIPVVSIDNMQVIQRCAHEPDLLVSDGVNWDFQLSKLIVKSKLPGAYHYLVSSFFFPRVRKRRTSLVPPILRPEILRAERQPGDHVLVYQTSPTDTTLVPMLKRMSKYQFRVYGMGQEGNEGNVSLRPFSERGFIEDLSSARAVVAGGGYSLMGEAVHLGVPMLSVPIRGQFEQLLNAKYLDRLGYGHYAETLSEDRLDIFLSDLDNMDQRLASYPRQEDNRMTLDCLDELLRHVHLDEPAPDSLESPAMGKFAMEIDDEDTPLPSSGAQTS